MLTSVVLNRTLTPLGMVLHQSPGDGHCLLHSVVTSWNRQLPACPSINLEKLKSSIFIETVNNIDKYIPFHEPPETNSMLKGMRKYLLSRSYNQSYGDIVPSVIANALKQKVTVINEDVSSGTICNIDIVPDNAIDNTTTLLVHRSGDHYNGIIPMPSVNPFPEKAALMCSDSYGDDLHVCQDKNTPQDVTNKCQSKVDNNQNEAVRTTSTKSLSYTRDELLNIVPGKLKRRIRKDLFSHQLWSPHVNCSNYRLSIPSQKSQTKNNLIKVPVQGNVKGVQYQPMTVCLFNAHSVRNKVNTIVDHIIEHNIDVCCITESWLTSEDSTKIAEITPVG